MDETVKVILVEELIKFVQKLQDTTIKAKGVACGYDFEQGTFRLQVYPLKMLSCSLEQILSRIKVSKYEILRTCAKYGPCGVDLKTLLKITADAEEEAETVVIKIKSKLYETKFKRLSAIKSEVNVAPNDVEAVIGHLRPSSLNNSRFF